MEEVTVNQEKMLMSMTDIKKQLEKFQRRSKRCEGV